MIGIETLFHGIEGFEAALKRGEVQTELAARTIVAQGAAMTIREAQKNFIGAHARGRPHVPNSGGYPNVVTGTLRRSITSDGIRHEGLGMYSTRVGPSTVYARAIELGRPGHNRPYPYFGPGVKRTRTLVRSAAVATWAGALRF